MQDETITAILGICGGIAAYKAVTVASKLRQAGLAVHVAMTEAAQEFVTPLTFSAVTRQQVMTSNFPAPDAKAGEDLFPHLYPATRAEVFCVLPATADILAKLAAGYADDIVCASAVPLPAACVRYICPSMNADMWESATVQENVGALRERGWIQLGPDKGVLACGDEGYGRMCEPEAVVERILRDLEERDKLAGKTVLILSGPTIEALDPVRFLSNRSSGKMGKALAEAASMAGARVEFITGPVAAAEMPSGPQISLTRVESAEAMLEAARQAFPQADAAVFVAAVADYRPVNPAGKKVPKSGDKLMLELEPTPDIAATLSRAKKPAQVCLGFALETHDGPEHARAKLAGKKLEAIVLNDADSLGAASGNFTLVTAGGADAWGHIPKAECAARMINHLAGLLKD